MTSSTLVGRRIGEYRFDRWLGAGGMGQVYQARDLKLDRDVAIKVLPAEWVRADRLTRFRREARALAAVSHPNIATIYDTVDVDDLHGLVLELADGPTLAARLAWHATHTRHGGGLPIRYALTIARQIVLALEAAHEKGIVHRDLKPANIVLQGEAATRTSGGGATPPSSSEMVVKVLDFGIAKLTSEAETDRQANRATSTATTHEGAVIGTAAYMSPEQARGLPTDRRTDLWSFGCVLFEMLTGRVPFDGKTTQDTLAAVLEREVDWTALPEKTPPVVRKLIRRCLEKDIARRLRDAGDARLEIEDALSGVEDPVLTGGAPSARWGNRMLAGGAFMALAGGLFAYTALAGRGSVTGELPSSPVQRYYAFVTSSNEEFGSRISPDGQWVSYLSGVGDATQLLVKNVAAGEPETIPMPPGRVMSQVWSPDGRQLAYLILQGGEMTLQVAQAFAGATSQQAVRIPIRPASPEVRLLRWVGKTVYVQVSRVGHGDVILQRVDLDEATTTRFSNWNEGGGTLRALDVSSDGRRVAFMKVTDGQEDLWISDVQGGPVVRITSDKFTKRSPVWASRDTALIFQSDKGGQPDLWKIDVNSGSSQSLTSSQTSEEPESTSHDGSVVTVRQVSDDSDLWRWSPATGAEVRLTDDALADFAPSASRSGDLLVFQRTRSSSPLAAPRDSTLVQGAITGAALRTDTVADGYAPLLSPDGLHLAFLQRGADRRATLVVRNLQTDQAREVSRTCPAQVYLSNPFEWAYQDTSWSPASTELYFVEGGDRWMVRRHRPDVNQVDAPLVVALEGEEIHDLHVSTDGRYLTYMVSKVPTFTLHVHDLRSGADHAVASFTSKTGNVFSRGWSPGQGNVVVQPGALYSDSTADFEVLVVSPDRRLRTLGRISRGYVATSRVHAAAGQLYVTRLEEGIPNLFQLSLNTGALRRVTANLTPGVTFSGVVPAGVSSIVGVRTERRSDLYLMEMATAESN